MTENQYTKQAQEALNMAKEIAEANRHPYIGTEHLLYALTEEKDAVAFRLLTSLGVRVGELTEELSAFFESTDTARKNPPPG